MSFSSDDSDYQGPALRCKTDVRMSIAFLAAPVSRCDDVESPTSTFDHSDADSSSGSQRAYSHCWDRRDSCQVSSPESNRLPRLLTAAEHRNSELEGIHSYPSLPPYSSLIAGSPSTYHHSIEGDDSSSHYGGRRLRRTPRPPRPSYSEEQRFYIMFCRIFRDMTWPAIEQGFQNTFGRRSKGGLTSVYYRIRRTWGLEEVLRGGANSFVKDREAVNERAANFSREFLYTIGYL